MGSTCLLRCEKCAQMPCVSIWLREGNMVGKGAGKKVRSRGGIWGGISELSDLELWESLCGFSSCALPGSWQAPSLGGMNGMWILHFTLSCENTTSSLPPSVQGIQDSQGEGPGFPHKSKWRLQYYNPNDHIILALFQHIF